MPALLITIDGPAGAGKSTVGRAVASRLGLEYLDTGAMYRSVALRGIQEGLDPEDASGLTAIAESMRIDFEHEGESALPTKVIVDGQDVTAAIRTPAVDATVSAASAVATTLSITNMSAMQTTKMRFIQDPSNLTGTVALRGPP